MAENGLDAVDSAGHVIFARDEWRRHGATVPACLVGIMLVAVHNYTLGAMIHPLEQAFGWSRAAITAGPMLPSMAAVVMAPLVGMAIDRFGPRRIALAGVPLFCGSLALLSQAGPSIVSWLALYFLLGVASMLIFPTVWTAAINARFDRNRGLALAVTLAGTGISSAIMPSFATALVARYGWASAYVTIAALAFVVVYPVVLLLFSRDEARLETLTRQQRERPLLAEMLAPRYLKLAGAAFTFGIAGSALTTNAVPILLAEGFSAMAAAKLAGWVGLGSICGRIAGGVLLDRFDARHVAALSMAMPAASVGILLAGQPGPSLAGLACFLLGLAAGTEYDACAYLAARHFGMRRFGALFGSIGGILLFANGIAPMLANRVYDLTRSYDAVLWALLPLLALTAVLFLALGRSPEHIEA